MVEVRGEGSGRGQEVEGGAEVLPQPILGLEEAEVEVAGMVPVGRWLPLHPPLVVRATLGTRVVGAPADHAHLQDQAGAG